MNKIILIDKPPGWTSFDVVAKIRNFYTQTEGQKVKVGHAGTLDPFATGLLIVLAGEATREQDKFMKLDKEYQATLRLGATSTTGDPEGVVKQLTLTSARAPSQKEVEKALNQYIGEINQTPPQYSAIKIGGKPAYKYARQGVKVEIKSRQVSIYELKIIKYNWPNVEIRVKCSSGTYIRTLAEDIGKSLEVGAYLMNLRRTKIGGYDIKDAQTIEQATQS